MVSSGRQHGESSLCYRSPFNAGDMLRTTKAGRRYEIAGSPATTNPASFLDLLDLRIVGEAGWSHDWLVIVL